MKGEYVTDDNIHYFTSLSAIECRDPGQPENGFRNGGSLRYPSSVSFHCFPGYYLEGLEEVTCEETAEWSGATPPECKGGWKWGT